MSRVAAVSQSAAKSTLARMSVGWCSPRYMRATAIMTGMTTAGIRNR